MAMVRGPSESGARSLAHFGDGSAMLDAMQSPPGGYGGGGPPPPGQYYGGPGQPGGPSKPITGSAQTMAMHAMTIDPKTGLPKGEKPPASPAAVLSLVCGILLCLGPITGLTAIIAGLVGRPQAQSKPQ